MQYYLGIDLGTSSVKLILTDEKGIVLRTASREYPLFFPRPGWSEQNPDDWWNAVQSGLEELTEGLDKALLRGIGCAGQMHGLVILDANDEVIRPCILWNDGRTAEETAYLNEVIGTRRLNACTGNIAYAGFTAPKLLWLRKHEPENFARIAKIMLPKDYINYRLTGVHACDFSDASGMLLLDVKDRRWSEEMLTECGITRFQMPALYESYEVIGRVKPGLMLPEGISVVAGAGDNAAAAVGTGTVGNGACNISLGTSGTVFISSDEFLPAEHNALHAFAHADGHYHLMGVVLSAASCNKWFSEEILKTEDYAFEQSRISDEMLGKNDVFFLPYLMGERSPINDTNARGCFIGLRMDTSRAEMVQAVLEGVSFAIRDSLEAAKHAGIAVSRSTLCGGGAKSVLWQTILANVLNLPIDLPENETGPGYGGAMLAMVGCGEYSSVQACAAALTDIGHTVEPDVALAAKYDEKYRKFRLIYPAMKELFQKLKE